MTAARAAGQHSGRIKGKDSRARCIHGVAVDIRCPRARRGEARVHSCFAEGVRVAHRRAGRVLVHCVAMLCQACREVPQVRQHLQCSGKRRRRLISQNDCMPAAPCNLTLATTGWQEGTTTPVPIASPALNVQYFNSLPLVTLAPQGPGGLPSFGFGH